MNGKQCISVKWYELGICSLKRGRYNKMFLGLFIIIVILCVYLIIQNISLHKNNKFLQNENRYLQALRDNTSRDDQNKSCNSERINNTKILFDIGAISDKLVIKDELDHNIKSIRVYISKGSVDIPIIDKLEEIAYIVVEQESDLLAKIDRLYVQKNFRRNKIASLLIKRVMEWAKLRNISEIYLFASASIFDISQEDLVEFYMKNGFECEDGQYMKAKIG